MRSTRRARAAAVYSASMFGRAQSWIREVMVAGAFVVGGCGDEKPPAPPPPPSVPATAASGGAEPTTDVYFEPGSEPAVITYAAARGTFADTSTVEQVPDKARGLVRISMLGGASPPPGMVWVANLRTPEADGRFALRTVARDRFEEFALGEGLSSEFTLPEGLEPPPTVPASEGVIVYKTAWCGVCKKVEAYLKRKGVTYEAKDIEKDREAASELQAKASSQGVAMGSVPVIDIGGQLIVGFDRNRMETLLGSAAP